MIRSVKIKMKIKKSGFTIIEMMVAIGFASILATMTVPNFMNMYQRYLFRTDVRSTYDLLLEARGNAVSSKNCEGGYTAESWEVRFSINTRVEPAIYSADLVCNYEDGDGDEANFIEESYVLNEMNSIVEMNMFLDDDVAAGDGTDQDLLVYDTVDTIPHDGVSVHFFTDSVRAKILKVEYDLGEDKYVTINDGDYPVRSDNARIVFAHQEDMDYHTICVNRISALPTVYEKLFTCSDL